MKLGIFTIVLDGMPFIQYHLSTFQQLPFPWAWSIVEGASQNGADTRWCQPQQPRLSVDGTHEYIEKISKAYPDRVLACWKESWENKTAMCNAAISRNNMMDCDVLLQVDVDEFHSVENIVKICKQFHQEPSVGVVRMPCRYFVGPDLVCVGDECWSNKASEWTRAWRFKPEDRFLTHEPPSLWRGEFPGKIMTRKQSTERGLSFDHYAYATLKQAQYKEKFYGYRGLVARWHALQIAETPVHLNKFFPFVDPIVTVKRLDPSRIPPILKLCS